MKRKKVVIVPVAKDKLSHSVLCYIDVLIKHTSTKLLFIGVKGSSVNDLLDRYVALDGNQNAIVDGNVELIVKAEGDLLSVISEECERLAPLFLIIDKKLSMGSRLFGGNLSEQFRKLPYPVISLGESCSLDLTGRVLMPLDLSWASRGKLKRTAKIAARLGAEVDLLGLVDKEVKLAEHKLRTYAEQCMTYLREKNIVNTAEFVTTSEDTIIENVLQYGHKRNVDLLVVIEETEGSLLDVFTGSLTQKLIDKSDIPVLSLIPAKRKEGFLSY